jgi:hypothetical protein
MGHQIKAAFDNPARHLWSQSAKKVKQCSLLYKNTFMRVASSLQAKNRNKRKPQQEGPGTPISGGAEVWKTCKDPSFPDGRGESRIHRPTRVERQSFTKPAAVAK